MSSQDDDDNEDGLFLRNNSSQMNADQVFELKKLKIEADKELRLKEIEADKEVRLKELELVRTLSPEQYENWKRLQSGN